MTLGILLRSWPNLEAANNTLVKDYEEEVILNGKLKSTVANFETKMKENEEKLVIMSDLKDTNLELVKDLENVEKNLKTTNKQIKSKDKEIYDLKKENAIRTENF